MAGVQEQYPEGYQYSQFCQLYRRYRAKLDYCMRQDHRGEKLFVDYGEGLKLFDRQSGEAISTELFVAVWGASNYTYAEATDPTTARLDRLARPSLLLLWVRAQDRGARLS